MPHLHPHKASKASELARLKDTISNTPTVQGNEKLF